MHLIQLLKVLSLFIRPRSYADTTPSIPRGGETKEFGSSKYLNTATTAHGKSYRYEPDNTNLLLVPSALKETKKKRYSLSP